MKHLCVAFYVRQNFKLANQHFPLELTPIGFYVQPGYFLVSQTKICLYLYLD